MNIYVKYFVWFLLNLVLDVLCNTKMALQGGWITPKIGVLGVYHPWHNTPETRIILLFDAGCLLFIHVTIDNATSIVCYLSQFRWSTHDPKKSYCSSFQSFDIRSVMVPLMMSSALCDSGTSASGITWPSCTSFQLFWPKEWNNIIFSAISTMYCQHWCQWNHTEKSCCTSFW